MRIYDIISEVTGYHGMEFILERLFVTPELRDEMEEALYHKNGYNSLEDFFRCARMSPNVLRTAFEEGNSEVDDVLIAICNVYSGDRDGIPNRLEYERARRERLLNLNK